LLAAGRRDWLVSAWCVVAAFGAYFCMYAFRKPYTVALYEGGASADVGYKTVLITAQTVGYMLSKFWGIKVVSETGSEKRVRLMLGLIATAEAALFLFAVTPPPYNVVWMFLNGLPLGMVFGLVLGFLEGRRHTEALAAGLCASFIVADGVVKSVGAYLLQHGVSEAWMPFVAGLLFAPPFGFFAWMLAHVPAPTAADIAARSKRLPMDAADRWRFVRRNAAGLMLLVVAYILVTIARSVRADFAREIWVGLQGPDVDPAVFGQSEAIVGVLILVLCGSVVFIRDNRRAFFASLAMAVGGALLVIAALVGQQAGAIASFPFVVLIGLGLYLPYIAVHTTIFERLIAMTRERGNVGFLMYLADSFGYLGFVIVMLARNRVPSDGAFVDFFLVLCWIVSLACVILLALCAVAFARRPATQTPLVPAQGGI
jgi:hypothetical protein